MRKITVTSNTFVIILISNRLQKFFSLEYYLKTIRPLEWAISNPVFLKKLSKSRTSKFSQLI